MQFRFEGAMTDPLARRQRFVKDCEGAIDIACTRLGFSEHNLDEPIEGQILFRAASG